MRGHLFDVIERLGGESDVDLDAAAPTLVARGGIVGEGANVEVGYLLRAGRRCRDAREERTRRACEAERDERRPERIARKKAGLPRFATYLINSATDRAVADEEFEAAEIARVEAEIVEAATQTCVGLITEAKRNGAGLGAILDQVYTAACKTRDCPIDTEAMTARFVEAVGDLRLADLFERTLVAGRACSGPAETEAAFSRLLATEGVAVPFSFAPEPARAPVEVEGAERRLVVAPPPADASQATPRPSTVVCLTPAVDGEKAIEGAQPLSAAAAREAQMEALTHVPGLVGDLVDWIASASMKPNRTLAFAAVLPLLGTLAGRLYKSERSTRTNIYTLGLAPSGFGKDHARACLDILVERAGLSAWMGGSKIASATGMRRRVEDHPAIMWMIDEFGGFMRQIGDMRSPHNHQIRDYLLEFYEKAGDVFRGADYAGEQGRPIHNPNVSLHGLSTPTDFWGACQSLSAADGLLARFMVFAVGDTLKPRVRPTRDRDEPPAALIDGLRNLTRARVGGNLNGRLADGSTATKPLLLPFGDGAEAVFYAAADRFDRLAFAKKGRPDESILARVVENALKLAMIVAIGVDADRPVITVERFEHGLAVAEHCAETTLREIKGRLADNDRQREHVDVLRMIIEAGHVGIGRTAILRRINGRFTERRLNEILQSLEDGSKEIVSVLRPTKGRPAMRFVAVENLGPNGVEG